MTHLTLEIEWAPAENTSLRGNRPSHVITAREFGKFRPDEVETARLGYMRDLLLDISNFADELPHPEISDLALNLDLQTSDLLIKNFEKIEALAVRDQLADICAFAREGMSPSASILLNRMTMQRQLRREPLPA